MDAIEALKTRRSVRVFTSLQVPRSLLEDMVDCARLAPSAGNTQPLCFVVVTDSAVRELIAAQIDHGGFIAEAPACILVAGRRVKYVIEDGSAATENLLLAARAHGLGSCWVAGDKKPYAEAILREVGVPGDHQLVSIVAVGYSEETPWPPKRPLSDVLHWERFRSPGV